MCSISSRFSVAIAALVLVAGCERRLDRLPIENAVAGAPPAVRTPVGVVPGPGEEAPVAMNPYAKDRVALTEGRKFFVRYNCAGCHGSHGGGGMGPSLRDKEWIYGRSDADIFDSIAEGRAHGMPAWGTKIPEEQIWKLVAYIRTMRTPLEPQAPEQK